MNLTNTSSLFLILLFLTHFSSKAQLNDPIGYYFTYDDARIDGYIGSDYKGETDFKVDKIRSLDFYKGQFTDLNNNVHKGYIRYGSTDTYFLFKTEPNARYEKIKPADCKGFIVQSDTFEVFESFRIIGPVLSNTIFNPKFLQKITSFNNRAYYQYVYNGNKGNIFYYYKENHPDSPLIDIPNNKIKLKEEASSIFKGSPWLIESISQIKIVNKDLLKVIMLYRYDLAKHKGEAIYLDNQLQIVSNRNMAKYFITIEKLSLEQQVFKYYSLNGQLQHEATYSSIYPFVREGKSTWYYHNGLIRKEIDYSDNEVKNTRIYDYEGKLKFILGNDENRHEIFKSVLDENGYNILTEKGNSYTTTWDPVREKTIHYTFNQGKIVNMYYEESNKNRIYLKAENNVKIRGKKVAASYVDKEFSYPEKELEAGIDGTIYISCRLRANAEDPELYVLAGINDYLDEHVLYTFEKYQHFIKWKAAKVNHEVVDSEFIIPIKLNILSNNPITYHHYDHFFFHHHMMNQQINVTPPPMPNTNF